MRSDEGHVHRVAVATTESHVVPLPSSINILGWPDLYVTRQEPTLMFRGAETLKSPYAWLPFYICICKCSAAESKSYLNRERRQRLGDKCIWEVLICSRNWSETEVRDSVLRYGESGYVTPAVACLDARWHSYFQSLAHESTSRSRLSSNLSARVTRVGCLYIYFTTVSQKGEGSSCLRRFYNVRQKPMWQGKICMLIMEEH